MRKTFDDINITPLTDIFLVLLIIMMVVAPLLNQQGIKLSVPENVEESQMDNKETKILTVVVTADNKYYINDSQISDADLASTIAQELKNYPDGMMIQTDGDSSHGTVVKLMDKAREAGVKAISVSQI